MENKSFKSENSSKVNKLINICCLKTSFLLNQKIKNKYKFLKCLIFKKHNANCLF